MGCRWTCFSSGVRWPSELPSNPHNSVILWNKTFRWLGFYYNFTVSHLWCASLLMEQLKSAGMFSLCPEHSVACPSLALIPSLPDRNLHQDHHHHGLKKLELQGTHEIRVDSLEQEAVCTSWWCQHCLGLAQVSMHRCLHSTILPHCLCLWCLSHLRAELH